MQAELGNRDDLLCFPHGAYNQELVDLAGQEGITYFFTGQEGANAPGERLIRRLDIGLNTVDAQRMVRILRQYDQDPPYAFIQKALHFSKKVWAHVT